MKKGKTISLKQSQQGAVLAFCLVFLVVLTVMAVGGMEGTIMEERMASNTVDHDKAFQAAEVSLIAGEAWLSNQVYYPEATDNGANVVWTIEGLNTDGSDDTEWWEETNKGRWTDNGDSVEDANEWWKSKAREVDGVFGVSSKPLYIIEDHYSATKGEEVNSGTGIAFTGKLYHRITAVGIGANSNSQVMVQSTYARRYE